MLALQFAFGHFALSGSREMATYSDNVHFWPIAGPPGTSLRPDGDCMNLKSVPVKTLQPGALSFPFIIGNNAAHIGLCSAYLEENGKETHLNDQQDCVSQFNAMTVNIPSVQCTNCVLKIKVAADHLGPSLIEHYDSCIDINITGASSPAALPSTSPATISPVISAAVPLTPHGDGASAPALSATTPNSELAILPSSPQSVSTYSATVLGGHTDGFSSASSLSTIIHTILIASIF